MKCWNCGTEMEPKIDDHGHPYELCPQCGATHCDLVAVGYDPLTREHDDTLTARKSRPARSFSPSRMVTRQAAKAREVKTTPNIKE